MRRDGELELQIVSDSMVPLIGVGQRVKVIEPINRPERYQIIVFHQASRLVCHYFSSTTWIDGEEYWITRSLKEPSGHDYPVHPSLVLGQVKDVSISWWRKFWLALWGW
jgi:hypothetical protein